MTIDEFDTFAGIYFYDPREQISGEKPRARNLQ